MAHQIDQIENHLESFFEGTLNRLVGLEMSPSDVAIKLSELHVTIAANDARLGRTQS